MLKLVYDLKAGFDDCYLTIKNEEWDLADELEYFRPSEEYEGVPEICYMSEEDFYNKYKDNIEGLLDQLESSGELDILYEDSVLNISKLYFSHMLGGIPLKHIVPVWEPSNWRLEYDPNTRSSFYYTDACSAKEIHDTLGLSRQQLYYYVKSGQIRKEYNPENKKQFRYNRLDVQILQKKLEEKCDRYSK
jgi:hypothetical protein